MMNLPIWWGCNKPYKIMDAIEGMRSVPDKSVDLLLTDYPYGETNEEWDNEPNYELLCSTIVRIIKDDGIVVLFGKFKCLSNFYQVAKTKEIQWFCEWIWEKPKSAFTHYHLPIWVHEAIHVYRRSNLSIKKIDISEFSTYEKPYVRYTTATSSKTRGGDRGGMKPVVVKSLDGRRHPRSVIYNNTAGMNEGDTGHLTPKPITLVVSLIKAYSKPGDIVLDPYLGTGTTILASRMSDRIGLGFEINAKFEPIIQKRIMDNIPFIESFGG